MNLLAASRVLGRIDARNVTRDPLLAWLLPLSLLLAAMFRYGVPPLATWLQENYQVDLVPHYPAIMSFGLLIAPTIVGTVIGFLLLDQRDDRTLEALRITPLTTRGYLGYRVLLPVAISVPITLAVMLIMGLSLPGWDALLVGSVIAAPMAALFALAFACIAENKVQGFALSKASGLVNLPAVVAWFIQSDWQLLFGITPTYWIVKCYWQAMAGEPWLGFALVGLVYQALIGWLLLRWFTRIISR
ncbi:MAG: hypothetical protein QNJ40_17570 [Xanthomonadales bacterium]|nr:hypothetical protein [Xanthomonadales bacterium]